MRALTFRPHSDHRIARNARVHRAECDKSFCVSYLGNRLAKGGDLVHILNARSAFNARGNVYERRSSDGSGLPDTAAIDPPSYTPVQGLATTPSHFPVKPFPNPPHT